MRHFCEWKAARHHVAHFWANTPMSCHREGNKFPQYGYPYYVRIRGRKKISQKSMGLPALCQTLLKHHSITVTDHVSKTCFPVSTTNARPLGSSHSFRYRPLLVVFLVRHCVHDSRFTSGLLTAMFGTAGTLMNVSKRGQNLGKACAHSLPGAARS